MDDKELVAVLRRLLSDRDDPGEIKDDECDITLRRLLGNPANPKIVERVSAAYWAKPEFPWPTPDEVETVELGLVKPCGERPKEPPKDAIRDATVLRPERTPAAQQSSTGTAS